MTEQLPDAQIATENESICEKLLCWRVIRPDDDAPLWCVPPTRGFTRPTPSFTTWSDAGLMLDAFERRCCDWDIERTETDEGYRTTVRIFDHRENVCIRSAGQVADAIRAAALEYIRSLP